MYGRQLVKTTLVETGLVRKIQRGQERTYFELKVYRQLLQLWNTLNIEDNSDRARGGLIHEIKSIEEHRLTIDQKNRSPAQKKR
jgi:hypothetical protein